jgi:hypothetical protein
MVKVTKILLLLAPVFKFNGTMVSENTIEHIDLFYLRPKIFHSLGVSKI